MYSENKSNVMTLYQFLGNFGVMGMGIGAVIGLSFAGLATSLSREIITPAIAPIFGFENLKSFRAVFWKFDFGVGDFISHFISFVIVCSFLYIFFAIFLKDFVAKVLNAKNSHPNHVDLTQNKIIQELKEIKNSLRKKKHKNRS